MPGERTARRISRLEQPAEEVLAWCRRLGALERLLVPGSGIRVLGRPAPASDGARRRLSVSVLGPLRRTMELLVLDVEPGRELAVAQVAGPFRSFRRRLRVEADGPRACVVDELVEWQLPGGASGRGLAGILVGPRMERSQSRALAFAHRRLEEDLGRLAPWRSRPRLRVAITGASGLVGTALGSFLQAGGHEVLPLVRRPALPGEIGWDPAAGRLELSELEGLDAVVHLAGESIASGRWTRERKRRIRESRILGTELLARKLASLESPPAVLVSASAVGWYGARGDEPLAEEAQSGEGFLADVCRSWEAATEPAARAGIRVVTGRFGVVLAAAGGALPRMLAPFRLGLGGRLGTGRQVVSWIALDDLVGLLHQAMRDETLSGPVNAVAPEAVTNAELTESLGRVLHRPTVLPVPAPVLRLLLGEMAEALLLTGARVVPARAQAAGFEFLAPDLDTALARELALESAVA